MALKDNLIVLTHANFDKFIADHDMVIIDFWAEWCGPCRSFAPVFEACAKEHPDILFAKVDIEQEKQLAADFDVRSIPLIAILREQIVLYSESGAITQGALSDLIKQTRQLDMKPLRDQIKAQKKDERT